MDESLIEKLKENIKECIGVPYIWGGVSLQGFDCSGLMQYLYKQIEKDIPRTSQEQYKFGREIAKNEEFKFGDLIFYNDADYVVMYLGENKILEASHTGKNVRMSNIFDKRNFCGVRRILD